MLLTHFSSLIEVAIALNLLLQFPQITKYLTNTGAQKVVDAEPILKSTSIDSPEIEKLKEIVERLKFVIEDAERRGHAVARYLNIHAKCVLVVLIVQLLALTAYPAYEFHTTAGAAIWWMACLWALLSPFVAAVVHVIVVKRDVNRKTAELVLAAQEEHRKLIARTGVPEYDQSQSELTP